MCNPLRRVYPWILFIINKSMGVKHNIIINYVSLTNLTKKVLNWEKDNVCQVWVLLNEWDGVLGGTRRRRDARSWRWKRRTPCSWRPCMSRCRCGEGRPPRPRSLRSPLSYCSSIWWVAGRSPQAVPAVAAAPVPSPVLTPDTTLTPTVSCNQQQL